MLKWLNDPELRRYAIMNSDKVVGNPAYAASAMKYFDPKDKKNLQYFIPVLCVTSDKAGEKFIRNFLIIKLERETVSVIVLINIATKSERLKKRF